MINKKVLGCDGYSNELIKLSKIMLGDSKKYGGDEKRCPKLRLQMPYGRGIGNIKNFGCKNE